MLVGWFMPPTAAILFLSPHQDLIKGLLTMDQDARVTAETAVRNAWIKNREREASVVHRQDTLQGNKVESLINLLVCLVTRGSPYVMSCSSKQQV